MLASGRSEPPLIQLDRDFYKLIDEFERRFPGGPPSLRLCDRLTVEGDVTFGSEVTVEGEVEVVTGEKASIPDGSSLRGRVNL
jgi:UTP--glucose-1-phosphate uridylyltransferase